MYGLVGQYCPEFQTKLSESGRFLPRHVTREFEDYLAGGRLEEGFLRLEPTDRGMVRYALKTASRDGRTHVVFEPLGFMAKLAALVPRPRTNLTGRLGTISWCADENKSRN